MGIKERQDRERQAVRESILDAACDLFVTDGYRNVSIRKIAERIEYSPAAIYGYFPGKDDIFFALAEEGFRRLDAKVRASAASDDAPPLDQLRRCWWSLYEFSYEQPGFFELMFVDNTVPPIKEHWEGFALLQDLLLYTQTCIQRVIDAGDLPSQLDPAVVMHVMWGAMMGPCVLGLGGRMNPHEDVRQLAHDVMETTLAGLRTGVGLTFVPCEKMHGGPHSGLAEPSGVRSHDA